MKIFLSYASPDRESARAIERNLSEQGHDVFFDRDDLPPGEEYHARIRRAIEASHLLVFLVSPDAVDAGSYSVTEVEVAEQKWKRASGRLLPVMLRPTPIDALPHFVRSVTVLETTGSVPAAVAAAVHRIDSRLKRRRALGAAIVSVVILVVGFGAWRYSHRGPPVEITGRDGAPAILVPAGAFVMGDDEESPRREVYLDAFYMDRYEVTTGRYAEFLRAAESIDPPAEWETLRMPADAELPVVGVDWDDASAYCDGAGKRLPTEAEWEKAARGTDGRRYPWGDHPPTSDQANYENMAPSAYDGGLDPVGSHRAGDSPYGLADMAGNAAEWVSDWYTEEFESGDIRNPVGPESGAGRVIRGGGRFDPAYLITATKRYHAEPDLRAEDIGFRCARDLR